jgi:GntR family colanic acid and biofilm gene transcriptional regulator
MQSTGLALSRRSPKDARKFGNRCIDTRWNRLMALQVSRNADQGHEDGPAIDLSLASKAVAAPSRSFSSCMSLASPVKDTLAERTYARLRHGLILGQIAPGERITLKSWARRLGTSATPVRDALSRLTAADALCQSRQFGAVAPILNGSELDELMQLRLAIEDLAFASAAPHYRLADCRRFKVLYADLCRVAEHDDPVRFAAAVWPLRVAILGLARSSVLTMLVYRIWCRFGPTFTLVAADIEQRRRISCLLGTLVTAIGNRDLEQARKALADEIATGTAPSCSAAIAPPLLSIAMSVRKAAGHHRSGADHE